MDIRNWPLDRIMQLPDCCFGRRWVVSCTVEVAAGEAAWDISEMAFPETTVLWELGINPGYTVNVADRIRICLGDQLPTTVAELLAMEPLIQGLGATGPEPRAIALTTAQYISFTKLRFRIHTAGRRLVVQIDARSTTPKNVMVGLVISSIPTEVPEWLISGQGRSQ